MAKLTGFWKVRQFCVLKRQSRSMSDDGVHCTRPTREFHFKNFFCFLHLYLRTRNEFMQSFMYYPVIIMINISRYLLKIISVFFCMKILFLLYFCAKIFWLLDRMDMKRIENFDYQDISFNSNNGSNHQCV